MATRSKGGNPPKKKSEKKSGKVSNSIHEHAPHLIDEAERVGASVIGQVRQLFDSLTHKISSASPSSAPSTPAAVDEAPAAGSEHPAPGLLDHVREAGEASVRAIGDGFESVRRRITERVASSASPSEGKSKGKDAPNKVSTSKKKTGGKKKTLKKKATAKKTAAKKKVGGGKKAASKKKVSARKKTGSKKKAVRKATSG